MPRIQWLAAGVVATVSVVHLGQARATGDCYLHSFFPQDEGQTVDGRRKWLHPQANSFNVWEMGSSNPVPPNPFSGPIPISVCSLKVLWSSSFSTRSNAGDF